MADHKGDMEEPLQRFATFEEYDKIWKTFVEKSPTEKRDWKIIQRSIQANKLDQGQPITMLDIGAGNINTQTHTHRHKTHTLKGKSES